MLRRRALELINLTTKRSFTPRQVIGGKGFNDKYKGLDDASIEKVTHTGQIWEKDDYRNLRFVDGKKLVNDQHAIKLVDEIPSKACKERVVYCEGPDGPLGHPRVYINLDKPGSHICGYCGLRFHKEDHH